MQYYNTCTWNLKHPFINGCFNWMTPYHYMKTGCFTKHPCHFFRLYKETRTSFWLQLGTLELRLNKELYTIRTAVTIMCCFTVDGGNPANQLRLVVYPILYRALYIPGGARFQPSTVSLELLSNKLVKNTLLERFCTNHHFAA